MRKTVYIGNSLELLKELIGSEKYEVVGVIGIKGRETQEYMDVIGKNKIPYLELAEKPSYELLAGFCANADIIVMCRFDYILPLSFVKQYKVFNFHSGDLRTNRGAHAPVWSILLDEKETCLSLYKLTGGIDEGELVAEYWISLDRTETVLSLRKKLACGIPGLLNELDSFLAMNKHGELLVGGEYRKKVKESDYTVDFEKDSFDGILAKIRSQLSYSGAICVWEGKKRRIQNYSYDIVDYYSPQRIITQNNSFIELTENKEQIKIFLYE